MNPEQMAETYSNIATANMTYEEYQSLKSRLQSAWLDGFKCATQFCAAKVEATQESELVGYSLDHIPFLIAEKLRDI